VSSGKIESISREGCDVNITVTTQGAGFWSLTIWDDSLLIDSFTWITSVEDGTHTATWTIKAPAKAVQGPGVGIYLALGATGVDQVDPYLFPDEVGMACAPDTTASLTLPGYTGSTTAGSTVNVHGDGYLPQENVAVSFAGELVGTFMTNDAGSFDGSFVVPTGTAPDKYAVVGVGQTSERSACAKVRVVVPPAGGKIGKITRDGCKVSIPVTTTGPGTYRLDVWDDGTIIDHFEWTVTTPGLKTIVWTITQPAGKSATGVGFYLTGNGKNLDNVDPYEYPDDVANTCSAAVPVTLVLPDYAGSTRPGATLTATGTGYLAGEQVKLVFASTPTDVGTVTTDSTGSYTTTFVVPATATADVHHLTATGVTSGRAATAAITVVALPTVPVATVETGEVMDASLTLASTGSDVNPGFATLALGLLVAGVGTMILGRRRTKVTKG
jgi:hypothetical protein